MAVSHLAVILALGWAAGGCRPPEETTKTHPEPPAVAPDAVAPEALHALVGEPVRLDGAGSVGDAFHWSTSDGQQADGLQAELVFDAPGHYTAILEASSADGRSDTDSVSISVTFPLLDEPPVQAQALAADGDTLFAVMPDFDLLVSVDRPTRTVLDWTPTCDGPRTVTVAHGARWVACQDGDAVLKLTDEAWEIALPWGSRPYGVVPSPAGVWVTLQGSGAIAEISAEGELLHTVAVGPDLRGLATSGDTVLASRWRSPDEGGVLYRLDSALSLVGTTLLPLDPGPDSDTNSRGVPNLLGHLSIRPDGRAAVAAGTKANIQRGLFRDGQPLTFETASRADLRQIALSPEEGVVGEQVATALFDDRDRIIATAWSPRGDWLFVLSPGMESVDVLDAYTLKVSGAARGVGAGADALWVSPALPEGSSELWVLATASRTLTVYDLTEIAVPLPLSTLDLLPPGGEILDPEVLAGKILFGRSVDPRMSGGGYLSCASCHPEGDHDGRTWDFTDRGEGLRNTISLLGRSGSAPIHWSANFDEIQDFENDIRYGQGGQGFLDELSFQETADPLGAPKAGLSPELDALAAYVRSLDQAPRSPWRAADGSLTALALQGEQIFLDPAVGCASCHAPPSTTDSAWLAPGEPLLHDVGTLGPGSGMRRGVPLPGLDTPSLQGLAGTAPYLHDGSAATVREVLVERNATDQHGVTSGLTPEEIDALEAYLLQL